MKISKRLLSAALALTLPGAALAQTAAEPAAAAPAPAPVVEKKKDEPKVTITPYGFVLADAFFNGGGFGSKDNIWQASPAGTGGTILMSGRGSRFGVKLGLKDDNWTGADLAGVVEFDFKAGFLPSLTLSTKTGTVSDTKVVTDVTGSLGAASSNWNAGLMRLRLASLTASWKGDWGSLQLLAGQDWGLVSVLNPETIGWAADPIATEAGNVWRRSPQFRLTYGLDFAGMLNASVAAAVLSPSDSTLPTDNGVGNMSRRPDIEVRGQVAVKVDKDLNATVGIGYHNNLKRFNNATVNQKDIDVFLWGLDADLNLTRFLQVKGEYFVSSGAEDSYTGLYRGGFGTTALVANTAGYKPLQTSGFWGQAVIKPLPIVWVTATYGQEAVNDAADLKAFGAGASTRTKNAQMAFGLLFNAGKYWRFGLEYGRTTSTYFKGSTTVDSSTALDTVDYTSQQTVVSTQLKF